MSSLSILKIELSLIKSYIYVGEMIDYYINVKLKIEVLSKQRFKYRHFSSVKN